MRFASLGSGSRGNATVLDHGRTRLLVDCGFSAREVERRLARAGMAPDELTGILVTHEHNDHIGGATVFARRHRLPLWVTTGTWRGVGGEAAGDTSDIDVRLFSAHERFAIGDLEVRPFPVPHDAREPAQFVFSDGNRGLGLLTDAGRPTEHIRRVLSGCDALVLESNHDPGMLEDGPYPPSLKARVGGGLGHLSNRQAAAILSAIDTSRLQHVVAAHISEKNNRPELARQAFADALGCEAGWIHLADQDNGLSWRDIA